MQLVGYTQGQQPLNILQYPLAGRSRCNLKFNNLDRRLIDLQYPHASRSRYNY